MEHEFAKTVKSIEEIINIPALLTKFRFAIDEGYLNDILTEIIKQSKVEFNYDEDDYDVNEYENGKDVEDN